MATNSKFDPAKEGATPFDPKANGATPIAEAPQVKQSSQPAWMPGGNGPHVDIPGLVESMIGKAKNVAQDVNAGVLANITAPQRQQTQDQSFATAKSLEDQASKEPDVRKKLALLKQAQDLYTGNSQEAQNVAKTFSPDIQENYGTRALEAGAQVGEAAALPGQAVGAAKTVGALAGKAGNALNLLSYKGAAGATNAAVNKATAEGATLPWDDISHDIRAKVEKTLGNTADVRDAINSLLSEKTPPGIESLPETTHMDPQQLLDWRRQISARGAGNGIFANLFKGSNADDKVASIARKVISNNIHSMVPETVTPDKMYSLMKSLGGDVPTWAKRIVVEELVKNVGGSFPGMNLLKQLPGI